MATTLFCRRLVSRPTLYRALCDAIPRVVSCVGTESQALSPPILDDERKSPSEDNLMGNSPALMRNLNASVSTIYEDDEVEDEKEKEKEKEEEEEEDEDEDEDPSSGITIGLSKPDGADCFLMHLKMVDDPPCIGTCNWFIDELTINRQGSKMGQPSLGRPFLAQMIVYGAIPDLSTFSVLVECYCKDSDLTYHHVLDVVFTQMKAMEVEADDSFYKTLMDEVCARFGPAVGYQLLKKLRSILGIQMPISCYDSVISLFRKRKKIPDQAMVPALIHVINMRKERLFLDDKIYNCLPEDGDHGGVGN